MKAAPNALLHPTCSKSKSNGTASSDLPQVHAQVQAVPASAAVPAAAVASAVPASATSASAVPAAAAVPTSAVLARVHRFSHNLAAHRNTNLERRLAAEQT